MGKVTGGAKFAKILLIIFNMIFFIIGLAFFAIGLWIITDVYKLEVLNILDNTYLSHGAWFIMFAGLAIFFLAGMGCCGSCCENKCMLLLYFIIVLVFLLIELIAFGLILGFGDKLENFLREQLLETQQKYEAFDDSNTYTLAWDAVQTLLECCGVDTYQEWADINWYSGGGYVVGSQTFTELPYPISCCKVKDPYAIVNGETQPINQAACIGFNTTIPNDYMNQKGCYDAFFDWVTEHIMYVGAVGIGLGVLQILGVVLSFWVYRNIKKAEKE